MTTALVRDIYNYHSRITSWMHETGTPFITQEIAEALYTAHKGYLPDNPPEDPEAFKEQAEYFIDTLTRHGLIVKHSMGRRAVYKLPEEASK